VRQRAAAYLPASLLAGIPPATGSGSCPESRYALTIPSQRASWQKSGSKLHALKAAKPQLNQIVMDKHGLSQPSPKYTHQTNLHVTTNAKVYQAVGFLRFVMASFSQFKV